MARKKKTPLFRSVTDIDPANADHTRLMHDAAANMGIEHLLRKNMNGREVYDALCMGLLDGGVRESQVGRMVMDEVNHLYRDGD
jgi:hypothetical protein